MPHQHGTLLVRMYLSHCLYRNRNSGLSGSLRVLCYNCLRLDAKQ